MKLKKNIASIIFLMLTVSVCLSFNSCNDLPAIPQEAEADILHIEFAYIIETATIDKISQTITAEISDLPNSNMDNLILTFVLSNGARAYIENVEQISGVTANDFTRTVEYSVVSGDGKKKKTWSITILKRMVGYTYEFSGLITENTILPPAIYNINGDIEIAADVYFAIEAGSTLRFAPCSRIIINKNAKFFAVGTEQVPIKFVSTSENNELGVDAWSDIYIRNAMAEFVYCIFENGGGCNNLPLMYLENSYVGIKFCTFRNILNTGIYLDATSMFRIFEHNEMKNCGETIDGCYPIHYKNINTILNLEGGNAINTSKGIYIEATNIFTNITFSTQSCPFIIANDITSSGNIAIFIQQGVSFVMNKGKRINLGNDGAVKFIARGTPNSPIRFYSQEKQAGSWEGIRFGSNLLSGSMLEYCTIEYAGNGGQSGAISCIGTNSSILSIRNCTITNTNSHGVYIAKNSSVQMLEMNFSNIPTTFQNIYYE